MIIDISENNGTIDWHKVPSNNPKVEGVFIKASEGVGFTDRKLQYNATQAHLAGIPIGYYHFASLNDVNHPKEDAAKEANYFLSTLINCPHETLPLVLDIETNKAGLKPDQVVDYISSFFDVLTHAGKKGFVLYSYSPFLNANLPKDHHFGNIPLWVAQYSNESQPHLPNGWQNYYLWQYTNKGKVNGFLGNVDLNKKP